MLAEVRGERDDAKEEAETMGAVLERIMNRAEQNGEITYDEICGLIGASPTPKGAGATGGGDPGADPRRGGSGQAGSAAGQGAAEKEATPAGAAGGREPRADGGQAK